MWYSVLQAVGATLRGPLQVAGLVLLLYNGSGCYHYRAIPQQPATDTTVGGSSGFSTEVESEVVVILFWGLVQDHPRIDNCNGQPLGEVVVTTNLGYNLLTILTAGIVSPAKVEWRCAKPNPPPGRIPEVDAPQPEDDP